MNLFASNFATLLLAFFALILIGAGWAIALSSTERRGVSLFVAPLIAMILIGSLGLFRIEVLVAPLSPKLDLKILVLLSFFVCGVFWSRTKIALFELKSELKYLLLVPILYLAMIAMIFQNQGFHTISGSQDEIQYSLNATFMYSHQHTGDALDRPGPRPDHWVVDFTTMEQPYNQTQRRGAELFHGFVFSNLRILAEQGFPISASLAVVAFLMALAFIGLNYFGISLLQTIFLQAVLAFSFHFLLFHIQGSLAYLCAIGMFFVAIAAYAEGLPRAEIRSVVLAGIVTAGTYIFYADAAIGVLLFPFLLSTLLGFWRGRKAWQQVTLCFVVFFLVTAVFSHQALSTALGNFFGNVTVMTAPMTAATKPLAEKLQQAQVNLVAKNWAPYGPISGWFSYYSISEQNGSTSDLLTEQPSLVVVTFFVLGFFGLLGFLRIKKAVGYAMALTLAFLGAVSILSLINQDVLRFVRSSSYSFPFAVTGLVLALRLEPDFRWSTKGWSLKSLRTIAVPVSAGLVLAIFLSYNLSSVRATAQHLRQFNVTNDPIVRHFDPSAPLWVRLRDELKISSQAPILFSGFTNTVFPHLISSGIQPYPHFLGESIVRFWQIHNPARDAICHDYCDKRYTSRLSKEEMRVFLIPPDWPVVIPQYLQLSRQAIVPVGAPYPVEWGAWRDIWPEKRFTFPNMCDVVYKEEYLLQGETGMFSERKEDQRGVFRNLDRAGVFFVAHRERGCFDLSIEFDAEPSRPVSPSALEVWAAGVPLPGQVEVDSLNQKYSVRVNYEQASKLSLVPLVKGLQVRKINWLAVDCGSKKAKPT